MKMLMILYTGDSPHLVSDLLSACGDCPFTEFLGGLGKGHHHRHEGTRAFPGQTTMTVSVLPTDQAEVVSKKLADVARGLPEPDRLHVAVLPVEDFR
jgi:hypothetical protein